MEDKKHEAAAIIAFDAVLLTKFIKGRKAAAYQLSQVISERVNSVTFELAPHEELCIRCGAPVDKKTGKAGFKAEGYMHAGPCFRGYLLDDEIQQLEKSKK